MVIKGETIPVNIYRKGFSIHYIQKWKDEKGYPFNQRRPWRGKSFDDFYSKSIGIDGTKKDVEENELKYNAGCR
jgi:hypothetical protein